MGFFAFGTSEVCMRRSVRFRFLAPVILKGVSGRPRADGWECTGLKEYLLSPVGVKGERPFASSRDLAFGINALLLYIVSSWATSTTRHPTRLHAERASGDKVTRAELCDTGPRSHSSGT